MGQERSRDALSPELIARVDGIVDRGRRPPPRDARLPVEEPGVTPPDAPHAPSFGTETRFGWIKERHPWGIRVDFQPCSVGGMTDVFAQNLVDVEDVGWRGCSNGQSWYKSIIRYRA
jgi:hypothetical protein